MLIIETSGFEAPDWVHRSIEGEKAHALDALNRTAKTAVDEIKADMPRRFTLRSGWVQKGIRHDKATLNNPAARVYSVDRHMLKQEEGEVWRPDGHVAIPSAARPSKSSLIPRSMLPGALRGRKDVFKADFSRNPSSKLFPLMGLWQRVNGGKKVRLLYLLKDRKHTRPVWEFAGQVESTIDRFFGRFFEVGDSQK
ncbi:MAG: hypothetical protein M3Q07_02480 [Pseudobdellovibrionaceae bacterium]|nr:hypothetical protein [Pseudobdellovibrionaceae bacterium]